MLNRSAYFLLSILFTLTISPLSVAYGSEDDALQIVPYSSCHSLSSCESALDSSTEGEGAPSCPFSAFVMRGNVTTVPKSLSFVRTETVRERTGALVRHNAAQAPLCLELGDALLICSTTRAIQAYLLAIRWGDINVQAKALTNLGRLFLSNERAKLGHLDLFHGLGTLCCAVGIKLYHSGAIRRASEVLAIAITMENAQAAYYLGCIYETGKLGASNLEAALSCYRLAAQERVPGARVAIVRIESELERITAALVDRLGGDVTLVVSDEEGDDDDQE